MQLTLPDALMAAAAGRLNQDCDCRFLDRDRLERQLPAPVSDAGAPAATPRFSDTAVFVAEREARKIEAVVDAIDRIARLPGWQAMALTDAPAIARHDSGAQGVFHGFDFHLGQDGPQLIEINTNAGGAWLSLALRRAQRPCCEAVAPLFGGELALPALEAQWLAMFAAELQRCRPGAELARVAIVDEAPTRQFLYPEFLLARDMFRRAGIEAHIADPAELHWDGHRLSLHGLGVDLIYNRLTDFYLQAPASAALRAAYLAGAAAMTPHPRAHALLADKRRLIALSAPPALAAIGAAPQDCALLAAHVPETHLLDAANAEALWRERGRYFFKPADGFGSRAAYRGDKLTRRVWQTLLERPYVAQRLAPPSLRLVRDGDGPATLKADVRAYVHDGRVQLLAARLYQGQTTNMRTPGGGFAPVLVLPSRIALQ